MNIQPRVVFETKTARTGMEAVDQYAAAEMWGGESRDVKFLTPHQFQFADGVKTYCVEMLKAGFQIIVISEG